MGYTGNWRQEVQPVISNERFETVFVEMACAIGHRNEQMSRATSILWQGIPARPAVANLRAVRPSESSLTPRSEHLLLAPLDVPQRVDLSPIPKLVLRRPTDKHFELEIGLVDENAIRLTRRLQEWEQKLGLDVPLSNPVFIKVKGNCSAW